MSILNNLMGEVQQAVAANVAVDMTQTQASGGGERKVFPEGTTLARLVGVIEIGKRAIEYQGQTKTPQQHVMLQFAMFSAGYTYDEAGQQPGIINTPDMSMTFTDKSKVKKLFTRMNWRGTAKHFAELLGQAFLISVKHNTVGDKTYVNLDLDSILPPLEPINKTEYNVPEAPEHLYRLLLWNQPTQQQWASLVIKDNEGKPIAKQWLQEKVTEALDYNESALYTLLHGSSIPTLAAPAPVAQAPVPAGTPAAAAPAGPAAAASAPAPWEVPAAPVAPAVPAAVPTAPIVQPPAAAVPVAPVAIPVPPSA